MCSSDLIHFLESELEELNRIGERLDGQTAFKHIKSAYDGKVAEHKAKNKALLQRLENLFAFIEEVFADGQEMMILVTELTVRYYCAKFISKFGCQAYFKHNQDLLFYERKQALLAEISDLED